ncbi:MAG: alpha/beta hydrolase, partial [Aquiluna sp.]
EPQTQAVEWSDCDGGFECADVAAPLNWLQAGEEYVSIRLMRKAGTDQLPAMLINPGGPGASTTDWMRGGYDTIGTSWLRQNFQLVAFDPRGVGESTAVVCSDDELKDQLLYGQSEFEYGSEEDISYSEDLMLRFAESCQESGPSPAYFNTQQTARDMEL